TYWSTRGTPRNVSVPNASDRRGDEMSDQPDNPMVTANWVDGNELAGPMQELFNVDITVARGRCAACGREGMMAQAKVYGRSMGMVARCPGCDSVLLRLVRGPDRAWLDMRGLTSLEFELPMEPVPGMVGRT